MLPLGYRQCKLISGVSHLPDIGSLLKQAASTGAAGDLAGAERCCREAQAIEARASLQHCVRRYIKSMDDDPGNPLLGRKMERFRFSGSWSCRLGT